MGYKDVSGKWVNIWGFQGKANDDASRNVLIERQATTHPVLDSTAHAAISFNQIMRFLGQIQLSMGQVHDGLDEMNQRLNSMDSHLELLSGFAHILASPQPSLLPITDSPASFSLASLEATPDHPPSM